MKLLQSLKFINVTPPGAIIDNASATTAAVDTANFRELMFLVQYGATDIATTAFKLTECDTSGGSYTDVDGADFSTDGTLPSDTADNGLYAIHVPTLVNRKRYQDLTLTLGNGAAGTYVSVLAIGVPNDAPSSATLRGLAAELFAS